MSRGVPSDRRSSTSMFLRAPTRLRPKGEEGIAVRRRTPPAAFRAREIGAALVGVWRVARGSASPMKASSLLTQRCCRSTRENDGSLQSHVAGLRETSAAAKEKNYRVLAFERGQYSYFSDGKEHFFCASRASGAGAALAKSGNIRGCARVRTATSSASSATSSRLITLAMEGLAAPDQWERTR